MDSATYRDEVIAYVEGLLAGGELGQEERDSLRAACAEVGYDPFPELTTDGERAVTEGDEAIARELAEGDEKRALCVRPEMDPDFAQTVAAAERGGAGTTAQALQPLQPLQAVVDEIDDEELAIALEEMERSPDAVTIYSDRLPTPPPPPGLDIAITCDCGRWIQLGEGCNYLQCKCGLEWCWQCKRKKGVGAVGEGGGDVCREASHNSH